MILENIMRLCQQKPISIAKLERQTGISNGTIRRWDTVSPSLENVRKVAEFFGVSIDALIADVPDGGETHDSI